MDDLEKVRFFDLGNVAVSLKKSLEFKLLVNKIRQLQDISSIEIDLRYARDDLNCCIDLGCLEPLDFEKPQNPRDARVIGALFVQSLVYYTRATKSESRHRGYAPITRNWTPELKNVHSDIVKIRDDIVAHFGPGTDHVSGFWSRESIVLCSYQSGAVQISTPFVRSNYREWAISNLSQLIDRAHSDCLQIKSQRTESLLNQIMLHQGDVKFTNALTISKFVPESFFVTIASAQSFYKNLGGEFPIATSLHPAGTH